MPNVILFLIRLYNDINIYIKHQKPTSRCCTFAAVKVGCITLIFDWPISVALSCRQPEKAGLNGTRFTFSLKYKLYGQILYKSEL